MQRLTALALYSLILLLASRGAMAAEIFPGVLPLPTETHKCLPPDDRVSFGVRGQECLYELRFADALPNVQKEARLDSSPCNLVSLGVAYDGLLRRHEAAETWQRARRKAVRWIPQSLGLELPLLHGDNAAALHILEKQLKPKFIPNGTYQTVSGSDKGVAEKFGVALERAAAGHPDEGARIITSLYRQDDVRWRGAVRYARAIMLLATNHDREARTELRLAAVLMAPMAGEDCEPQDDQWSAIYLLEHLH